MLVVSSRRLLASLPATPLSALVSALLRVSLAFTSTGMKPISLAHKCIGLLTMHVYCVFTSISMKPISLAHAQVFGTL